MLEDDSTLLDMMLADQKTAPAIFQPTNYWRNYVSVVLPELRRWGLHGFRRRKGSFLSTFGATDPSPHWRVLLDNRRINNHKTQRIPGFLQVITWLDNVLTDTLGQRLLHASMLYGLSAEDVERDLERRAVEHAIELGKDTGARPLRDLMISLEGDPKHVFYTDGKPMTMSLLDYYIRYTYVCRFVDFAKTHLIVELGSGSGKQVEVVGKLHPDVSYFLFDMPPQLYVCEQFLKAVFGDRVVSYRECRSMTAPPKPAIGKIYLFGNWQFPIIESARVDLFWNAASLQEMEPDVVQTYLASVEKSTEAAYLMETMAGMAIASRPGAQGVLKQTLLEHYERFLPSFERVDMRGAVAPLSALPGFDNTFWLRRRVAS
jgi:putative sugar O-methyltransferase